MCLCVIFRDAQCSRKQRYTLTALTVAPTPAAHTYSTDQSESYHRGVTSPSLSRSSLHFPSVSQTFAARMPFHIAFNWQCMRSKNQCLPHSLVSDRRTTLKSEGCSVSGQHFMQHFFRQFPAVILRCKQSHNSMHLFSGDRSAVLP